MTFVQTLPRLNLGGVRLPQFAPFSLVIHGYIRQVEGTINYSIIPLTIQDLIHNYFGSSRSANELLLSGCITKNIAQIREALGNGANPSLELKQLAFGTTSPITLCAQDNDTNLDIAKELLNHCDTAESAQQLVSQQLECDGSTPLHHAAANSNHQLLDLLLSHHSPVHVKDIIGRTALMEAANVGSLKCVTMLLHHGANVDDEDKQHHTALSYVLDRVKRRDPEYMDCAMLLVHNGANPNCCAIFNYNSVLHCAVHMGKQEFVEELVSEYHAEIITYNEDKQTPIDLARYNRHTEIEEYLICELEKQQRNSIIYWIPRIFCLLYCIVTIIAVLLFVEVFSSELVVNVSVGIILIICGVVCCVVALGYYMDCDCLQCCGKRNDVDQYAGEYVHPTTWYLTGQSLK